MEELNFIAVVRERDVDLLLLEELSCNAGFRAWFSSQVFVVSAAALVGVYHSVTRAGLGESDLVLLEALPDGTRRALMIENKIDALPQPRQAQRYRERGQLDVAEGRWHAYRTVLVAPQDYLDVTGNVGRYDTALAYEAIRDWLAEQGQDSARLAYRARVMTEAIEQNRRGYQPMPHEAVTEFWERYWRDVRSDYPQLQMKRPGGKPGKASWPQFQNDELGRGIKLFHKLRRGNVDLQIEGGAARIEDLRAANEALLEEDMILVAFRRSAAVRIKVPEIDHFGDFDDQIDAVNAGLSAATRLLALYPRLSKLAS